MRKSLSVDVGFSFDRSVTMTSLMMRLFQDDLTFSYILMQSRLFHLSSKIISNTSGERWLTFCLFIFFTQRKASQGCAVCPKLLPASERKMSGEEVLLNGPTSSPEAWKPRSLNDTGARAASGATGGQPAKYKHDEVKGCFVFLGLFFSNTPL